MEDRKTGGGGGGEGRGEDTSATTDFICNK
jgi:hypothetical protein